MLREATALSVAEGSALAEEEGEAEREAGGDRDEEVETRAVGDGAPLTLEDGEPDEETLPPPPWVWETAALREGCAAVPVAAPPCGLPLPLPEGCELMRLLGEAARLAVAAPGELGVGVGATPVEEIELEGVPP